ncbi:MAG: hypothetical protein COA44_01050 [Arcobacter sp.]|nr:MAG: hypothetical protein COA44_01050 [Arcobacter sp.]
MIKTTLFLTLCSLNLLALPVSCDIHTNNNFVAKYTITTPHTQNKINYYRVDKQRAFEYLNQGITEVWTKAPKNQVTLIRGFDKEKRSIEYESIDLKMENKSSVWDIRKNIMNPESFNFTKPSKKHIKGCTLRHYGKIENGKTITMDWNKEGDVLVRFEVKKKDEILYLYTLDEFQKIDTQNNHLKTVMSYDRTDFADIGDNESDPFFRKMINLGFISHHEANIIDAEGNTLSLEDSHEH